MTGEQAWQIISPIIAKYGSTDGQLNAFDEAYILVFGALKAYDEKKKENKERYGRQRPK